MSFPVTTHVPQMLLLCIGTMLFAPPTNLLAQQSYGEPYGGYPDTAQVFLFEGGTLEQYANRVKDLLEEEGTDAVVYVAPEVKDTKIPPVKITYRDPATLLGYLSGLGMKEFGVNRMPTAEFTLYRFSPPPRKTTVFSLRGLVEQDVETAQHQKLKEVISAIEAALEIGELSEPEAKLKYHPETALLFVSATPDQVEVVEQVVSRLASDQRLMKKIDELKAELAALKEARTYAYPEGSAGTRGSGTEEAHREEEGSED